MNRGVEKARLFRDGDGPGLGLWYGFRQKSPTGDYAGCLEEIEEGERPGFAGAWLSGHHFLDAGYLPSPPVVAVAARTRTITIGTNVLLPMHQWKTDRGEPRPGPIREEDRPGERYPVGLPGEAAEGLMEPRGEAPYYHFCFRGRPPGVTHDGALENPRPFATEVVPRVRDAVESKPA